MIRTIDALLESRAETDRDTVFLRFARGDLTFGEVADRACGVANGLAGLGVDRRDLVAIMMPNCAEFAITWFGISKLGAVTAPVNTALRGLVLVHVLNLTAARVVVADADLIEALEPIANELEHVRVLIVRGDIERATARFPEWDVIPFAAIESSDRSSRSSSNVESDVAIVLFTSGTTGRSKGCMLSHRYAVRQAELMIEHLELRSDDVLFCPFPMFHLDASILTIMPALVLATTAALAERFSASTFWEEVRDFGATVFDFMGATLAILHKQPATDGDASNPARLGWGVPLPEFTPEFEARFGVRLVELYGSTDVGVPMYTPLHEPRRAGSCGRPIDAYEVSLVDGDDCEAAVGDVGEIIVRPREPSLIMDGYLGMPRETIAATRNLWFHTGDLARRDADGYMYFVGRQMGAIRRRGENISSFEIEEVVDLHPDVFEVAAFGVASELSEQDVMIAVVALPGRTVDPSDLIEFCQQRMARYMVPRYIDVVDSLPKTPTEKVEKYRLVERGITANTWDRESPDVAG